MIHQKQDKEFNCGQTCISMITGVHIREVERQMRMKGKTHTHDLRWALMHNGFTVNKSTLTRIKRWDVNLPKLCILRCKHIKGKEKHWVVHKEGIIYDPVQNMALPFIEFYEAVRFNIEPTSYMEITK